MDIIKKAYILYTDDNYIDVARMCIKSIRQFSNLPIIAYMLNSDKQIDVPNTKSVRWDCNIDEFSDEGMFHEHAPDENFYVNRANTKVYNIIIQRPLIIKHALLNYADVVAYIDSDSIATSNIDKLFDLYDMNSPHPYLAEGIYEWMFSGGRGGCDRNNLSTTLEHLACELFNADQNNRKLYRSSNVSVSGKNTLAFLDEWHWMCVHPKILKDCDKYAPFQDETIINVLLWKYNYQGGLPYIYVNADSKKVDAILNTITFSGVPQMLGEWFRIPGHIDDICVFHGEKRISEMQKMLDLLTNNVTNDFLWDNTYVGFKETITREIFEDRIYERLFSVEEGDVVFDIGASVGPFTYSILNKHPKHVFCFEPSYPEFKTLMLNVRQGPVTCINKGITDKIGKCDFKFIFEDHNEAYSTTFKQVIEDYNLSKIDFLKTDCEGGEYDIFTIENLPWINDNVKKIAGEWHLSDLDLKDKFRMFRDTYLSALTNYKVFSIDGIDVTNGIWSETFIQYYTEIIIYIDNR